jgi:hypothetical protein
MNKKCIEYLVGELVTQPKGCHKDNQDIWSPPITYFHVEISYNLGKDDLLVGDAVTEV